MININTDEGLVPVPPEEPSDEENKKQDKKVRTKSILWMIVSGFFVLNVGCGLIEIPDFIPIIGNLDEIAFMYVFLHHADKLGYLEMIYDKFKVPQELRVYPKHFLEIMMRRIADKKKFLLDGDQPQAGN